MAATSPSPLQRLVLLRPGEGRALFWAAAYFFFLLLSLYLLRPAREILYIPLGPEEKYKSKPFIDTFVFRGGDFLGVWAPAFFSALAVPVSLAALAVAGGWVASAAWLGRLVNRRPARHPDTRITPEGDTA